MDIKIGNYRKIIGIVFGFFGLLDAAPRLELRVVNRTNDTAVTTLSLGHPYTLEIKAEGAQDLYKCTIPGLENFHSEFCGASHLNLMSHITTVHSYVIRADKLGTFSLGPVQLVTKNGVTLTSNALTIKVEQQEQSDIIVELIVAKKSIVVGQRITGVLRINSCINSQLLDVKIPPLDPEVGEFVQLPNHTQTTQIIDGKNYACYEIPVTLLVKKTGKLIIPKIGVLCRVQSQKQQRLWGFGFSMHGSQDTWFYTNDPMEIEVAALPLSPTKDHLLGVGLFDSISLRCKQKSAMRGEGIVAILDIIGKEGLDDVLPPPLSLPAGLKYYDSKASVEKLSNGLYKKSCEYIIQATQDSNFEISSQVYNFFDPYVRTYKQLKTNPVHLEINGGKENNKIYDQQNENDPSIELFDNEKIGPLKTDGPWTYTSERSIPLGWFFFYLLIIIGGTLFVGIKNYLQSLGSDYWLAQKRKNAFKFTRRKLAQLKKHNNYVQLYDVFSQLFRDRCQLLPAQVTAQTIEERLKDAGFVRESLEQWNRFFLQLAELAYSRQAITQVPDDLFKRALMWINQLEEKL